MAAGIEGGLEALQTISNMRVARRQIDDAKRLENELQDPAAPPTTPKSQELAEATESARRDLSQPIREIDPILQRNVDMLRQGMSTADTVSGVQAGLAGAGRQAAINQSRNAMNQMIPAIENIRREQKAEYNRLISAGISEDDMRFKQAMQKYRVAENRYLTEAQAIGGLAAQGNANLYGQQADLYGQMGQAVNPLVNFNYGGNAQTAPSSTPQVPQYNMGFQDNPYQTGLMTNNIAASTSQPMFTAIGNLDPKAQEYGNNVRGNLEGFLNNWNKNPYLDLKTQ
jgi:hypothetical protein